jgi:hypothetical protein
VGKNSDLQKIFQMLKTHSYRNETETFRMTHPSVLKLDLAEANPNLAVGQSPTSVSATASHWVDWYLPFVVDEKTERSK